MKTAAAYYLLIFYTLAICKPVLPLVKDFIAHTLWVNDHHALVHKHHGSNHVHQELAETTREDKKSDGTKASIETPVSIHVPVEYTYSPPISFIIKARFYNGTSTILALNLSKHYPPPKA